jgi:acyl carrier protein phosphodiesterase
MNYLAHGYLADTSEQFLIGSFMGDFVKGQIGNQYSPEIMRGIMFHRKIDIFADRHEITLSSRNLFSQKTRRFAGIILDICYDHFLSKNWADYSDKTLPIFIDQVYDLLHKYREILPQRLKTVLPHMVHQNWLGTYLTLEGVEVTLNRISKRISRKNSLDGAMAEIRLHYDALENNFLAFFPDLVAYAKSYIADE